MGPREQREAQVDGCAVQGIGGLDKVDANALSRIEILSPLYEDLSIVPEYPPIPILVGIGQRASCYFSTNSGMIQLFFHSVQTGCNVSQAFPEGQLSEDHYDKLSVTTENTNSTVSSISLDTLVEVVSRQKVQQLRETYSSFVHWSTPRPSSGGWASEDENFLFQIEKTFFPRRHFYSC
jgi:hypothetical protein